MELAALLVAFLALLTSVWTARRQLALTQRSNDVPALIDLFREFRSPPLVEARLWLRDNAEANPITGIDGLPENVRSLMWFHDHLGVLVAHRIVDLAPVAGFLGGSLLKSWRDLKPYILVERARRANDLDPGGFQQYFENLAKLLEETPPSVARGSHDLWRLGK
jgi:hypothetical protein